MRFSYGTWRGTSSLIEAPGDSYEVAIFHNNKHNFIIIYFIININKKINKTTIINITNNKPIFIIIYFIINNTINKTINLKRKLIINKILIFIINKNIEHNLIFNIIFNNITSYKVAQSYTNKHKFNIIFKSSNNKIIT